MDAQNKPAENVSEAVSPAANDQSAARWRLILLLLCALGAGLVIGILALQVTEYRFYKASPNVWPQPGAGGTLSAPATLAAPAALAAPLVPVTPATSSASPAPVATTTVPSETAASVVPVPAAPSMPAVAATSAPEPAATTP